MHVKLLRPNATVPTRGTEHAAGYDLYACANEHDTWIVHTGNRAKIPTGIALNIPHGYYGRISPRSGLALKNGIGVLGGIVDSDYTGEIFVILHNHCHSDVTIKAGDRIAQIVFLKHETFDLNVVDELTQTNRGENGFGSTGN